MTEGTTKLKLVIAAGRGLLITTAVARQLELLEKVRGVLPEKLRPHCIACTVNRRTLVIHCDTPSASFQIRFLTDDIKAALVSRWRMDVFKVSIKTLSTQLVTISREKPIPVPSHQISELLAKTVATISHIPLRASLNRLRNTLEKFRAKKNLPVDH